MPWVKLDDGFAEHPKILAAGPEAAWLHVAALCYCARRLTDGHVPTAVLPRLADVRHPERLAQRLVAVGLWHADPDGWVLHDFLEFNMSRADVEAQREKKAAAGRAGGKASGRSRAGSKHGASQSFDDRSSSVEPPTQTRPDREALTVTDDDPGTALPAPSSSKAESALNRYVDWQLAEQGNIRNPARWREATLHQARGERFAELELLAGHVPSMTPDELVIEHLPPDQRAEFVAWLQLEGLRCR